MNPEQVKYVLDHFYAIYEIPGNVSIGYGPEQIKPINITKYAGDFFLAEKPWPTDTTWQDWKNVNIPLLFYNDPVPENLITYSDSQALINFDILASAFYFLSGWQEYYSSERDKFDRFPYASSLQKKLNIITLPVVNYYFDILKTAIEKIFKVTLKQKFNNPGTFTSFITHDIDNTESAWKAEGIPAFKTGNMGVALELITQKIRGKDAWFNWPEVQHITAAYGATSSFFFLSENQPYHGTANADFNIIQNKYQEEIKKLEKAGAEINMHGSLEASINAGKFKSEKEKLSVQIIGNRFHYLSFNPKITPALLDEVEINLDSTLGFAEHFGFRNSYCFPFRLYNFNENKPYNFLEIPLNLMDATLNHPNYLKLDAPEIVPAITPMLNEIKKFGGCFTLLWHNENFTVQNKISGLHTFKAIMQQVVALKSNFKTGSDLYRQFN